jgi:hypothetical protein
VSEPNPPASNESQSDTHTPPDTAAKADAGPTAESGGVAASRTVAAILVAFAVGWAAVNFLPRWFKVPEELMQVDMSTPLSKQIELEEKREEVYWRNNLVNFTLLGLCLGAVPLLRVAGTSIPKPVVPAVTGLVLGLVCGPLAFLASISLRGYFDAGGTVPLVTGDSAVLAADMAVFIVAGVVLSLPIAIGICLTDRRGAGQKSIGPPLAAVVSGLLMPIGALFLFPNTKTNVLPTDDFGLSSLWLAVFALFTIVFTTVVGARKQ